MTFTVSAHAQQTSNRETAIRNLGVAPLTVFSGLSKSISAAQAEELSKNIAAELTQKSFLTASYVQAPVGLSKQSKPVLAKAVSSANKDALVVGDLLPGGFNIWIISRSGSRLGNKKIPMKIRALTAASMKTIAAQIVDEVVHLVPYRGFLTRETEDGVFELNMGADHGLKVGQRLRVFEFETGSLESRRDDRGEVEVIEVSGKTSLVEVMSDINQIRVFQKVGFDELARGMVVDQQIPKRGFATVGVQLLSIDGSSKPGEQSRSYTLDSTPAFSIGVGIGQFSLQGLLAQAKNDDLDLVFTEILGLYKFRDKQNGLNRLTYSLGARLVRFGVTTRRNVVAPLESSSSIAPVADVRYERLVGGPIRLFASAALYYPMFNSGNGAGGSLFSSFGINGSAGSMIDISSRWSVGLGFKLQYVNRPIESQSAVSEKYTQLFADVIARF